MMSRRQGGDDMTGIDISIWETEDVRTKLKVVGEGGVYDRKKREMKYY